MEALLDKLERELSSQMVALLQQSDDLLCSVQIGEEGRAETEGGGGVDGDPIAGPNIARHLNHDKVLRVLRGRVVGNWYGGRRPRRLCRVSPRGPRGLPPHGPTGFSGTLEGG